MKLMDPPAAPEGGSHLRSGDLINTPCIVRATAKGTWGEESRSPGKPYMDCEVWTLDRAGVVEHESGVRFSWWKAVDQLSQCMGELVACRPVKLEDNSIELAALTGPAREVAVNVAETIGGAVTPPNPDEFSDEAF